MEEGIAVERHRRVEGVNTTALDLLKWQESFKTTKILSQQSISEMEIPQVKGNVDGSDAYGYGLAIKRFTAIRRFIITAVGTGTGIRCSISNERTVR